MMLRKIVASAVCILLLVTLTGCGWRYREPVRHLASDASLLVVGTTTKKEAIAFLGEPDERRQAGGEEVWVYHQARKSLLRKTPYLGDRLGQEEHDVMNITFKGDILASCVYRLLDAQEVQPGDKAQ